MGKTKSGLMKRYFRNYLKCIIIPFVILYILVSAFGTVYIVSNYRENTESVKNACFDVIETEIAKYENAYTNLVVGQASTTLMSAQIDKLNIENVWETVLKPVSELIDFYLRNNDDLRSLELYSDINDVYIRNGANMLFTDYRQSDSYRHIRENRDLRYWAELHTEGKYTSILLINIVASSTEFDGFIAFGIDASKIGKLLKVIADDPSYNLVLRTGDTPLYTLYPMEGRALRLECSEQMNSRYGITMDFYSSGNARMSDILFFNLAVLVSMLLILVVIIKLAGDLSNQTYKPIDDIVNILENPDNTELLLGYYTDEGMDDAVEMKYIIRNIAQANSEHTTLKEDLESTLSRLNELRQKALEAQIEPHFLYNTMSLISLEAYNLTKSENIVSQMIGALAELMKSSFRTTGRFVTVADEINHVRQYILLQTIKYEWVFDTRWHVDKEIEDCMTTRMLLQPIVENALLHGVMPAKRRCTLDIRAEHIGENIVFTVSNDGAGIPQERLEEVEGSLRKDLDLSRTGIGLTNVNRRLRIIYGEEYGCFLSQKDGWVTVKIVIPYADPPSPDQEEPISE